jgi:hypothetical protein
MDIPSGMRNYFLKGKSFLFRKTTTALNSEIGKPMRYGRKGTRELYIRYVKRNFRNISRKSTSWGRSKNLLIYWD